jgi:hypothetical protein
MMEKDKKLETRQTRCFREANEDLIEQRAFFEAVCEDDSDPLSVY